MKQPYLRVRQVGASLQVDGVKHYCAGNKEDGIFVEWFCDGKNVRVSNDRYGFYPAYYYAQPGQFAISTSIPRLLELLGSAELSDVGIACFLRLGYFPGDYTAFRQVRALPPSATVEWANGSPLVTGKRVEVRPQRMSRSDAIDGYISLFREAIGRRLPNDRFAIPLSGGRDSRHILLELATLGYRPDYCITARTKDEEVDIARFVAMSLGIEHTVVGTEKCGCHVERRKNLLTNFHTHEHGWVIAMTDFLEGKAKVLYDGIGGDVLSAGLFLTRQRLALFEAGRLGELAATLMPLEGEPFLERLLRGELYGRFNREAALAELENELRQHQEAPNPIASYFLANRTRRAAAQSPLCLLAQVGKVFCPYLDQRVHDFLASLPAETYLGYMFHTDMILQAYPRYASVPFETKRLYASVPFETQAGYIAKHGTRVGVLSSKRFRRFAVEALRYAYCGRPPKWSRTKFILPRLLRCALSGKYAASAQSFLTRAVYLIQLERLCYHQGTEMS